MGTIPASLLRLFAPIEHLLTDPSVRRVMVDGPDRVFIERDGHTERVGVAYDAAALAHSLRGLAERAGKPFDAQRPCLEAMLKDGTRFLALCSPVVDGGPVLAISLPGGHAATLSGLVQAGALTGGAARTLGLALRAGLNIIVAGPPGGGRARLLEALCAELPPEARVATLQDGGALTLPGRPAIRLTPRKSEGEGRTVTGGDLLYCAGRMAVDRVVVADLRLADGWDAASLLASRAAPMLLGLPAMTPTDALSRLAALARASAARERDRAVEGLIAAGVDLIVLVGRWGEAPPVLSIDAVEARDGVPVLVPLFTRRDADDVLAATPSVEPLRARWQRLVPPSAPVGATRIERVDPPQPGAETRVERAAGEPPDGERLARAAASGEVDPDARPGTSDEAPTADAPPQASDERPAVDAPAVDPPNRDEAPLAADAPSPPPEAALDESVDISVDLPPAAGAEGKTTEALAMDVPFAAPALSVEAPSLPTGTSPRHPICPTWIRRRRSPSAQRRRITRPTWAPPRRSISPMRSPAAPSRRRPRPRRRRPRRTTAWRGAARCIGCSSRWSGRRRRTSTKVSRRRPRGRSRPERPRRPPRSRPSISTTRRTTRTSRR